MPEKVTDCGCVYIERHLKLSTKLKCYGHIVSHGQQPPLNTFPTPLNSTNKFIVN